MHEHYMASIETPPALIELNQEVKKELVRVKERMLGKESVNNIPLFNGKYNFTRNALKGLKEQIVI